MRRNIIVLVSLMLTLSGCSLTGPDRLEGSRDELIRQRQQWQAQNIRNYTYVLQVFCFCPDVRPVHVRVINGAIESATYTDTGGEVPSTSMSRVYTIDGLFQLIESAISRDADSLGVEYNVSLHYPTAIEIDYITNAADDELVVSASNLQAIVSGS